MVDVHLLLALEEEVVCELVLPVVEALAVEAAYSGVDKVEVKHSDMGPGAEGGRKLEGCCKYRVSKLNNIFFGRKMLRD